MTKKYLNHRVVKFNLEENQPELDNLVKNYKSRMIKTNHFLYGLIKQGLIDIDKTKSQYLKITGMEHGVTHAHANSDNLLGIGDFIKENFDGCQAKYWRGVFQYVLDRYLSFYKRNRREIKKGRKSLNFITIKCKELQFKNQMVALDEDKGELTIFTHLLKQGKPIVLKYVKNKSFLNHVAGLGSSQCDLFGGNLILKQGVFAACCAYDKYFAYEPVGALGFDLNKTAADFIHTSDPINGRSIFPKIDTGEKSRRNIAHVEKVMKFNNDLLNSRFRGKKGVVLKTGNRPFNHKKSNSLRKKNKSLHRHHTRLCQKLIDDTGILDHVMENKLLLCIDSVGSGQQNGSFGQDKVIPYLIKMCENRGIPFIIPPVKFTSQRCPNCNHVAKSNRKNTAEFECVSCGHKENSHSVGAQNVKRTGLWLWENHFDENKSCDFTGNKWLSLIQKHFLPAISRPAPPPIGKSALKKKKTRSRANKRRSPHPHSNETQ